MRLSAALLSALLPALAHAQPAAGLPAPSDGPRVSVTLQRAFFESEAAEILLPLSLVAEVQSGRVGPVQLQAALPLAMLYTSVDAPRAEERYEATLGNLYLGLAGRVPAGPWVRVRLGAGVWAPLTELSGDASDALTLLLAAAAAPDRPGGHLPGATTVVAHAEAEAGDPGRLVGRVRLAPQLVLQPAFDGPFSETATTLGVGYAVEGELPVGPVALALVVSGTTVSTFEDDEPKTYLGFRLTGPAGPVELGVSVRTPVVGLGPDAIGALGVSVPL